MIAFKKSRHLLPAAALFAATFFLVSAVPHVIAPVVAPATVHRTGFNVVRAEIHLCEASGERTRDECIDEVEAKALIQHAEQLAEAESRRGTDRDDDLAAAAHPVRSRLQ